MFVKRCKQKYFQLKKNTVSADMNGCTTQISLSVIPTSQLSIIWEQDINDNDI